MTACQQILFGSLMVYLSRLGPPFFPNTSPQVHVPSPAHNFACWPSPQVPVPTQPAHRTCPCGQFCVPAQLEFMSSSHASPAQVRLKLSHSQVWLKPPSSQICAPARPQVRAPARPQVRAPGRKSLRDFIAPELEFWRRKRTQICGILFFRLHFFVFRINFKHSANLQTLIAPELEFWRR